MSEPGYTEISGRDCVILSAGSDGFVASWGVGFVLLEWDFVSECDRGLVKVGAKLRYSQGWLVTPDGHKSCIATIRFKGDDSVDNT